MNVTIHKSTSAMIRLAVAGEYSIAMPAVFHDVVREKNVGSPIDFARGAPPVVFTPASGDLCQGTASDERARTRYTNTNASEAIERNFQQPLKI